jgi:cytochrome c oxidase accessory protein FixG
MNVSPPGDSGGVGTRPPAKDRSADSSFEQALYARRSKIYPREVHGFFASMRVTGVIGLMGIFYGVPWITWTSNNMVRQAILWDLPGRKFHIFGLTFWPQDFIYLAAFLIIAALSLFFFTAIAGRLWCGYACPQTVWTEVFLWIERKIEGGRSRQMKLASGPWNINKIIRRSTKHGVWILLSLWTGYTFVGYFTPIRDLGIKVMLLETGAWETFWIIFYGFATYGNAGWLREQVCIYMCPYARFQSAMFDKDTLVISYDSARGEPRGSRKKSADPAALGLGSCVNCTMCVQVCPTGIDIRDGMQYECIGCAACIDACDDVMDKISYPRGLIRYTTENALAGIQTRVSRPRVWIYGAVLSILLMATCYSIFLRVPVGLDVIRDRNALFRETSEGLIENVYTLKLLNKHNSDQSYRLDTRSTTPMTMLLDNPVIEVATGEVGEISVRIQVAREHLSTQSFEFEFELMSNSDPAISAIEAARFVGPAGDGQ